MLLFWFASILIAVFIADNKKLSVGMYFFLALLTGPLAILIAVLSSSPQRNSPPITRRDPHAELQDLRYSLEQIRNRIDALENSLGKAEEGKNISVFKPTGIPKPAGETFLGAGSKLGGETIAAAKSPLAEPKLIEEHVALEQKQRGPEASKDMEVNFGRFWLPRIGIVVFTLGVGFLISYTFKYFGPFLKIAFGYSLAAGIFFLGARFEKQEKFLAFGRVLLGGGWALVYFTTYAMHHFPASRLIANQVTDLVLLAAVAAGMIAHAARYRSQAVMSVALFVAYLTSTTGQVTSFTFISSILLALVVLFLVYRFFWVGTFVQGIVLTYGIHCFWVAPNIEGVTGTANYYSSMNLVFLTLYALVFLVGAHIARVNADPEQPKLLAGVNFGNIALYCALAYPLLLEFFYEQRFWIVLGLGSLNLGLALWMKALGRRELFISDLIAGIFMVTFAVPLKFLPTATLLFWLIEIPCLLLIGCQFKEKIFRYLSYALSVWVAICILFGFFGDSVTPLQFFNWSWQEFMCFWAAITNAVCFYLTQRLKVEEVALESLDDIADQIFSAMACLYFTIFIWGRVHQPWLSTALSVEGIILATIGVVGKDLFRFRLYAYGILLVMAGMFIVDGVTDTVGLAKALVVGTNVLAFFIVYWIMKIAQQTRSAELIYNGEEKLSFWGGVALLVHVIFQYVLASWITLALCGVGVLLILIGFFMEEKTERLGGLFLFALALLRLVFVDLAGLDMIFKIITFTALGALFVGISYFYNRFNFGREEEKRGDSVERGGEKNCD